MTLLLVSAGGLAGVLARYGIGLISPSMWATLSVNLVGSFLLGVLVHAAADWSPAVRDGIGIGLLGGFTTFSTFSVQAVLETDGGRMDVAALYVVASVAGGLAAAFAGYALGRTLA